MVEIEYLEEEDSIRSQNLTGWLVDIKFYLKRKVLWFHTPFELPNFLKSQHEVATGKMISF